MIEAASVQAAVLVVEQAYPDVLITDIHLPDADGYTLLDHVKALAVGEKQCSAIAVTGLLDEEECRKLSAAGFQEYLLKPVDLDQLIAVVAKVAGATRR